MEKKFADQILTVYCTILYSKVLYRTGYHPPPEVKFLDAIASLVMTFESVCTHCSKTDYIWVFLDLRPEPKSDPLKKTEIIRN